MQENKKFDLSKWHKMSDNAPGIYHVVNPQEDECSVASIYRLNINKGDKYSLKSETEEMNGLIVEGTVKISGTLCDELNKLDSFYIPGNSSLEITAESDTVIYIGAAVCEGYGEAFVRHIDFSLPVGDIHQIHGEGSGQREVMFTLSPQDKSSRLLCGITWSADGQWTSWPPHQHEKDLEEVYCYFDIASYGLHFSYLTNQTFSDAYCHVVQSGSMVQAPVGYHPTAAVSGSKNVYFWVLAAHSHESRRYDLAVSDPDITERI